jgi:hypothetical protein
VGGGPAETALPANVDCAPAMFTEDGALARARNFRGCGYVKINATEITTQHRGRKANIWVSPGAVDAYRALVPSDSTMSAHMPPGTQIVKEHTGAGEEGVLLVLTKGPAGIDPERSDWYWMRVEQDGTASFRGFRSQTDSIDFCIGCHTPAQQKDWVFGVALDNRAP